MKKYIAVCHTLGCGKKSPPTLFFEAAKWAAEHTVESREPVSRDGVIVAYRYHACSISPVNDKDRTD